MNKEHFTENRCRKVDCNKIIKMEENRKSIVINNPERRKIFVCRVDECLIKDNDQKKCDYIIILDADDLKKIVLIELKGKDYGRAIEQILNTARILEVKKICTNIESIIVASSVPKASTSLQSELAKKKNQFNAVGVSPPLIKNNVYKIEWP